MSAGQSPIDWPALVLEALADIKANKPLPPSPPVTEAEIKTLLSALEAELPNLAAEVKAYPGVIAAAGRILTAWEASGKTWAAPLKAALYGLPGGLAAAEQFMPFISGMIDEFSPVPGKFLGID